MCDYSLLYGEEVAKGARKGWQVASYSWARWPKHCSIEVCMEIAGGAMEKFQKTLCQTADPRL